MYDKMIDMALGLVVLFSGAVLLENKVFTTPPPCDNDCRLRQFHCYDSGLDTLCWEWQFVDCYYCTGANDRCEDKKDAIAKGCETGTLNDQMRRIHKECNRICEPSAGKWQGTCTGDVYKDWADAGTKQHDCTK